MVLLALLVWLPAAHAGVADAPGADLEVSLVTYGPGAIYWERFGHDAIEVRDRASGEAVNFNYGVFDFEQKNFLLNFARGHMRYRIDAEAAGPEIGWYIGTGRWVQRQRLALTAPQAAALRDFLLWNLRPQNAQYDYDYFADNCTTRVRDALDRALGGALHAQLQAPSPITYRQQTDRLMAAQPWLMLALDLGLGPYADQPLSRWQAGFIPMTLMQQLRDMRVTDGHGGTRPLVIDDTRVADARLTPPPAAPPDLRLPLFLAGLVLAVVLAWSGRARRIRSGTPCSRFPHDDTVRLETRRSKEMQKDVPASAHADASDHAVDKHLPAEVEPGGTRCTEPSAIGRAQRIARVVFGVVGTLWLVFAGMAGVLLVVLWAFTAHRAAWANENLLLFNPLALALLPSVWRARASRFARGLVVLLLAAAVFALLAKLLPGFTQHNLPWILFALPPWLALAYALRSYPLPCLQGRAGEG